MYLGGQVRAEPAAELGRHPLHDGGVGRLLHQHGRVLQEGQRLHREGPPAVCVVFDHSSSYRVTLVDFYLGEFLGWLATSVDSYCQGRIVEYPKSWSTAPRYSTTRVTL